MWIATCVIITVIALACLPFSWSNWGSQNDKLGIKCSIVSHMDNSRIHEMKDVSKNAYIAHTSFGNLDDNANNIISNLKMNRPIQCNAFHEIIFGTKWNTKNINNPNLSKQARTTCKSYLLFILNALIIICSIIILFLLFVPKKVSQLLYLIRIINFRLIRKDVV